MTSPWSLPDFDAHEGVHLFHDRESGLRAIIAIHSTHLGPGAGGVRFWHYARDEDAITDALRLSRGMSYKNAMAGLPMGGGKGVILADADRRKTPELLRAFGDAIASVGGRYVTAEDVGISEADMAYMAERTPYVSGLPVAAGEAGGDPGPVTAQGVYLGIKAAAHALFGSEDMRGIRVAIQGVGSVGGGVARHLAAEGALLTLADVDALKAGALATELGAATVDAAEILSVEADILSPNALGAILNEASIGALRVRGVAGGANNQLATPADAARLHERGILYAPDYVINAGGIINVALAYLGPVTRADIAARVGEIPGRLRSIWTESADTGLPPSLVADHIAQRLIGRS
ncbi:MAG TPA: Glu/Leu/Phe/Val dehydrogenase dimerization domain-containing protein [Sphingobium sp.]|uniref:Glu/Leu/Phe/Val family dehydrogenase n=1 Tax=Sphingobium sp. TaxID=1912891 RepID=UPI002ED3FA78